jgi:uncharacterized protein (DUF433 family)
MSESDALIAFTENRAAELAGVGVPTLRRWTEQGLVGASVVKHISPRNTVRLYGFDDLVGLLVLTALRDVRSHQFLRSILVRLRREYARPLIELRFAIDHQRGEIYFQHPDGSWEGDRRPHQVVLRQVLDLEEIRALIREKAAAPRPKSDVGVVQRQRRRVGSKPVFAGTRIPVEAVREYLNEGAGEAEILEAFPRLTRQDISVVRKEMAAR